jgi:hypothetical protein
MEFHCRKPPRHGLAWHTGTVDWNAIQPGTALEVKVVVIKIMIEIGKGNIIKKRKINVMSLFLGLPYVFEL